MKKHFIIFLLSLILLSFTANAADINIAHIEFDKFDFADDKPIFSLLSEEKNFRMDFSLLEGVLTVEIIDSSTLEGITSEEAGGMVLFISDYNEKDVLLDIKYINEVSCTNQQAVTGIYQKAFLMYGDSLRPVCASLSTKCDYDIVEGVIGEWEVTQNGHMLSRYKGSDSEVIIPNSYNGKRIYTLQNADSPSLSKSIFYGNENNIRSVTISEGIKNIGHYAFFRCSSLSSFPTLPESVTAIGGFAFAYCSNMTGTPNISSLTIMYPGAFFNCSSITGSITLPSISSIPDYAFYNCRGLSGDLVIPSKVTEIGDFAFGISSGVGSFTSLTFAYPSSLKYIGSTAFQKQTSMKNILSIPDTVVHIGDFAFNHCSGFTNTSLTLPSSLRTIGGDSAGGDNTGYGCHVFYNAFRLNKSFIISENDFFTCVDGVLYSKDKSRLVAYPQSKSGSSFVIPEGVTQIDEMAFAYSNITTVTLPDSYVISETVPDNVINNMANTLAIAFYHNNSIKEVLVKNTNTRYTSSDGILYSSDMTEIWYVPTKFSGDVYIPEGTLSIMQGAFYIEYATGGEVYTGVHIPSSVTSIAPESLKSINLRPLQNITVNSLNTVFTVKNGKLAYI